MAKITDAQGAMWLGSKFNTQQMKLGIPGGPSANQGGVVFIERIDGSGDPQNGIWLHTDGTNLLYTAGATAPADTNTGTAITGAGADTALSNIASVQIPDAGDFIPVNDNQVDLGSSSKQFKDIWSTGKGYFDDLEVEIAWIGDEATKTNCLKVAAGGVTTLEGTATFDNIGISLTSRLRKPSLVLGLFHIQVE